MQRETKNSLATISYGLLRMDLNQLCADTSSSLEHLLGMMNERDGWRERERERESKRSQCLDDDGDLSVYRSNFLASSLAHVFTSIYLSPAIWNINDLILIVIVPSSSRKNKKNQF